MRRYICRTIGIACCLWALIGCRQSTEFKVEGVVAGADGQTLYLEHIGLEAVAVIDSVKLSGTGKFAFKEAQPEYPDFYRLRLNNQLINFAIDSTETVSFVADAGTFATSYTVEGSQNCVDIREITLAQLDVSQALHRLRREFETGIVPDTAYRLRMLNAIDAYKNIALKHIYAKPMSTPAYFALFQQIDGLLLFDPYDKTDARAYGAVATSINHRYPESPRAKHLYNLALQSLSVVRSSRPANVIDSMARNEVNYIDIELPTPNGQMVKLSDVANQKVVILNFTAYRTEWSPALNNTLSQLYSELHAQGLEIYQVSLDNDLHLWKNIATELPWHCVRDPQSVYSQTAALYNVRQLPTLFLLNRNGVLIKRIEDMNSFGADVRALF